MRQSSSLLRQDDPRAKGTAVEIITKTLLSKWGLEDGDVLDPILGRLGFDLGVVNTSEILVELVKDHVLPLIENVIEVEVVATHHNPIRITRVDGVLVDNFDTASHERFCLQPERVQIAEDVIGDYATRWLCSHSCSRP